MILPVHDRIRAHIGRVLRTLYSLDPESLPAIALDYPPNRELGDLGSPVAFELARRLRKSAPPSWRRSIRMAGYSSTSTRRTITHEPSRRQSHRPASFEKAYRTPALNRNPNRIQNSAITVTRLR